MESGFLYLKPCTRLSVDIRHYHHPTNLKGHRALFCQRNEFFELEIQGKHPTWMTLCRLKFEWCYILRHTQALPTASKFPLTSLRYSTRPLFHVPNTFNMLANRTEYLSRPLQVLGGCPIVEIRAIATDSTRRIEQGLVCTQR